MEQDSTIGVAQAKILLMNKRDTFDCAGVFINAIGFGIRGLNEKDRDQYDHLDEILCQRSSYDCTTECLE